MDRLKKGVYLRDQALYPQFCLLLKTTDIYEQSKRKLKHFTLVMLLFGFIARRDIELLQATEKKGKN